MQKSPKIMGWQKSIAVNILFSLFLSAFATSAIAASRAMFLDVQPSTPKILSLQNEAEYQLTQVSNSCHQVSARSGLYVRREPTVYSTAIGIIPYGRYVTTEEGSTKRWVRISAPLQGYVFAGFINDCQSPPPPSNCRQVSARSGVYVRQEPTVNSAAIGIVPSGRNVTIENSGTNGWVRILAPLQGHVFANYLTYCS